MQLREPRIWLVEDPEDAPASTRALHALARSIVDDLAVEANDATGRWGQAGQDSENRTLSGSGRADEADHLSAVNG